MEPPRSIRKVITTNSNTLQSPASSGRSTPATSLRIGDRALTRPASPSVVRQQYTIKRPPSANRFHDVGKRAPSPFEGRSHSTTPIVRPGSSMSSRALQPMSLNSKGAENTIVSVRIGPSQANAIQQPWLVNGAESFVRATQSGAASLDFSFDHVFPQEVTNDTVYQTSVKKLVAGVVEGFHGTVFAYGMTGTGKTYSMQGAADSPGIIPQAVQDVLRLTEDDSDNQYSIRVSYLEIYNERIRDLLNETLEDTEEIKIREDAKRGIYAYPLVEIKISSMETFMRIMEQGDALRHSAATDFNAHSSRSHAVIQLIVECVPKAMNDHLKRATNTARISTLNLIDLAGSEKAATDVERRKEGSYINKSLLTLGTVIARLTSSNAQISSSHVPFRDSKLTRLLQNALSGLSLVSILATINTDSRYVMETTNTLKFASRAKFIPGKAKKAELFGGDTGLLVEGLRSEILSLRLQLAEAHDLIHKLQPSTLNLRTISDDYANSGNLGLNEIHEDESIVQSMSHKIRVLESEKVESDAYIRDLQAKLMPQQTVTKADQVPNLGEQVHKADSVPTSPNYAVTKISLKEGVPSTRFEKEENVDKLNALADQELASSVLSKSQRSREEARNLTLQIAQLKKREDKKMAINGRHAFWNKSPLEEQLNTRVQAPQHTLVSPTIRAPREGFI